MLLRMLFVLFSWYFQNFEMNKNKDEVSLLLSTLFKGNWNLRTTKFWGKMWHIGPYIFIGNGSDWAKEVESRSVLFSYQQVVLLCAVWFSMSLIVIELCFVAAQPQCEMCTSLLRLLCSEYVNTSAKIFTVNNES